MRQPDRFVPVVFRTAFGDKKLNIPESGNGVPDILDEARWQMEFMMAMQVPEGQPLEGMVHHKMHDAAWTALGLAPHEATGKRYLRPPSTAATLNTAATAAQCARIWKSIDAKFAKQCLTSAERAWAAAQKNPKLFAPNDSADGGGPYDDAYVADDFYWAAAELYIATGKKAYRDALEANEHHKKLKNSSGEESLMNWADTDALGAISLAVVPNGLGKTQREAQREQWRRHGHHAHMHRHVADERPLGELRQRPEPDGGEHDETEDEEEALQGKG